MSCCYGIACGPQEKGAVVAWWGREVWVLAEATTGTGQVLQHATLPDRVTALLPLGPSPSSSSSEMSPLDGAGGGSSPSLRLAIATADKVVRVGALGLDAPTTTKEVPKKVVQLLALPSTPGEQDTERLLLADKFGDVHRWDLGSGSLRSLVGHVSQLTCMVSVQAV
jgi:hypothetical protein